MKYLFFTAAMFAVLPGTAVLLCKRAWIRWATLGLSVPLLLFDETAVNFFSRELYRGTARGMEISIIHIVAVIMLSALTILKGPGKLFPDRGSRLYLCYFLCCLPSLRHADDLLFSFFELWKMVMAYLVFLAVYRYLEFSRGDCDVILYGIAIVVAVNFIAVVIQHFRGIYQVRGLFPHQNSLAMYMLAAGLLFFGRWFNRVEPWRSWGFLGVFLMASVMLVRTYSRGALVCYPAGGLVTLYWSIRRQFRARMIFMMFGIGLIGLVGLLLFLPRIVERFEKAPESSGETRRNLAVAAVNMMKDAPLTGVGINNWGIKINPPYRYSRHREERHYKDDYKDGIVETIYLLVGAECGIPCLLVLLGWFSYYWIAAFRLMKRLRGTPFFYLPAGMLGGMTGMFLQSLLEWVLKQQINFLLLMTLFAIISYWNKHGRELTASGSSGAVREGGGLRLRGAAA